MEAHYDAEVIASWSSAPVCFLYTGLALLGIKKKHFSNISKAWQDSV